MDLAEVLFMADATERAGADLGGATPEAAAIRFRSALDGARAEATVGRVTAESAWRLARYAAVHQEIDRQRVVNGGAFERAEIALIEDRVVSMEAHEAEQERRRLRVVHVADQELAAMEDRARHGQPPTVADEAASVVRIMGAALGLDGAS